MHANALRIESGARTVGDRFGIGPAYSSSVLGVHLSSRRIEAAQSAVVLVGQLALIAW
jgi:hypothetical protein